MQHTYSQVDVLIVGAGPVGMVLACELRRHGLHVRIVDKSPATKQFSRAPVFWPRAQEALQLMRLHHLWDGACTTLRRMNVNVYDRPAGVVPLDECESAKPVPLMVGQDVTEQILERHLRETGCPVDRGVEVERIEITPGGAKAWLAHVGGERSFVEADWIIGCDGTHSTVRAAAGMGWEGRALRGLMVPVADAKAAWCLPDGDGDAYVALTQQGYLLAIPMPGLWRVIVATPDTGAQGQAPGTSLDSVARLAEHALGGPVRLHDPKWVSVVRYGNHMAPTFRAGRALLAGDAAHSIAPLSGQGMNVGIQDAFDLAWKLSYVHKGWAADALLDTYTTDRKPVAQRLVRFTNRFFDRVLNPGPLQRAIGRFMAPRALQRAAVRAKIAGFYTGTDIAYEGSPLNDRAASRMPRPGQFARDAAVVNWAGLRSQQFFDSLDGMRWSVVIFSGALTKPSLVDHFSAAGVALQRQHGANRVALILVVGQPSAEGHAVTGIPTVLVDPWRALHDKYQAQDGAILLVRPDGYVSMNAPLNTSSQARLTRFLGKTLLPPATLAQ